MKLAVFFVASLVLTLEPGVLSSSANLCQTEICWAHPTATCREKCGSSGCRAEFFEGDKRVDCYRPCPFHLPVAMCSSNPCLSADCPAHPEAQCRVSFCGPKTCAAQFYKEGYLVDCEASSAPKILTLLAKSSRFA